MENYSFIVLIVVVLSLTFVSADYVGYELEKGANQIIDAVEGLVGPFASVFLGGSGDLLFERILFFAIVFSIVYVILSTRVPAFSDQKAVVWVVTIAVSLLSTRFLTETQIIRAIIFPHSVLGIVLSSIIPFMVFFFFVESFSDNAILRKTLWIFFAVVFIGLWAARYGELGDFSWIYMITGIAAFFFLLFDGTIRRVLERQKMRARNVDNKEKYLRLLRKDLEEMRKDRGHFSSDSSFKNTERKLMKEIKNATKSQF
jgi:hypothetical protein